MPKSRFIFHLKARNLVSRGCIYHLVQVDNSSIETPTIQSVSLVSVFKKNE